jgi:hypothetical protein
MYIENHKLDFLRRRTVELFDAIILGIIIGVLTLSREKRGKWYRYLYYPGMTQITGPYETKEKATPPDIVQNGLNWPPYWDVKWHKKPPKNPYPPRKVR